MNTKETTRLTKLRTVNTKAFTLTEIIIVVIIISIIAAFAIPQYNMAIEKARQRSVWLSAIAIHGAQKVYKAQYGEYWGDLNWNNIDGINTALGINIIPKDEVYYGCHNNVGPSIPEPTFTCEIILKKNGVIIANMSIFDLPIGKDISTPYTTLGFGKGHPSCVSVAAPGCVYVKNQ